MDLRWLDLKPVALAIRRPSCRLALGLLGLGLSAFAWPYFPPGVSSVPFASMFSLGAATALAWIGTLIDARVRAPRQRRRYPR
jgi:hypothetical protein